jgi:hypothetical protein
MGKQTTVVLAVAVALLSGATNAESAWPKAERSAFVSGCGLGIIVPAKRDYAAAAERAGNANPKPFPEDQLRESVEPMCGCLADRMADNGMSYLDALNKPDAVTPMIQEAMAGGRCKPGGLLGQMLFKKRHGSGTE